MSEYTQGEMQRAIGRLEDVLKSLNVNAVTKAELQLHLDGLRLQLKYIDDRHVELASTLQAEKKARIDAEAKRDEDAKTNRRLVIGALVAAVFGVLIPLVFRGVGIT